MDTGRHGGDLTAEGAEDAKEEFGISDCGVRRGGEPRGAQRAQRGEEGEPQMHADERGGRREENHGQDARGTGVSRERKRVATEEI